MEHVHNISAAYQEILRVTKPGGLIYCIATPLWNSYQGHHLYDLFPDIPWMHLRYFPGEIAKLIDQLHLTPEGAQRCNQLKNQIDAQLLLDGSDQLDSFTSYGQMLAEFMFFDYFNFLPASHYVETVSKLPVNYLLKNDLWQDGEALLTSAILKLLNSQGVTREESLYISHTHIAIK